MKRSNYRIADNIDYLDGDLKSSVFHPGDQEKNEQIIKFYYTKLYSDRGIDCR